MLVDSWSEIMGIQSAVYEAIDREEKADDAKLKEFEDWKKNQEQE